VASIEMIDTHNPLYLFDLSQVIADPRSHKKEVLKLKSSQKWVLKSAPKKALPIKPGRFFI
jgi:hypothetical protein